MWASNFLQSSNRAGAAQAAYDQLRKGYGTRLSRSYDFWGGPSALGGASVATGTFGTLFTISMVIFIIFLTLVFVHFTLYPVFSLSPNSPGIIPINLTTDRELAYTKEGDAAPSVARNTMTGLVDPTTQLSTTTLPTTAVYTIGTDVYINGAPNPNPYPNVILYRDLSPNTSLAAATSPPPDPSLSPSENFMSIFTNTNIVVWLDQTTNDLQLTLITSNQPNINVEEFVTAVENVPLNKTFRLTIIVAATFVELYINGALQKSMPITGSLMPLPNGTDFYPPINDYKTGNVKIQNMSMWPRILTSKEIRAYESSPMSSP